MLAYLRRRVYMEYWNAPWSIQGFQYSMFRQALEVLIQCSEKPNI